MGFFDHPKRYYQSYNADSRTLAERKWAQWYNERQFPRFEIPHVLSMASSFLSHGPRVALAVTNVRAYRNEIAVVLTVWLRDDDIWESANQLDLSLFRRRPFDDREPTTANALRLGVQFSDGRKATNLDDWPPEVADSPEAQAMLMIGSVFGRDPLRHRHLEYWISPLPSPGSMALVYEWPAVGIGEGWIEIDGRALRKAARQSILS